jgi:hypothetical protein
LIEVNWAEAIRTDSVNTRLEADSYRGLTDLHVFLTILAS